MFFEIQRILAEKRPKAFILENVKQLRGHDKGRTLSTIMEILRGEHEQTIPKDIEMSAEDLRLATRHLGSIVGKVDVEEILESIFKDFCIGK